MKLNQPLKLCLALAFFILMVNFTLAIKTNLLGDKEISFTYSVKPWYKYDKDGKAGREVVIYFNKQLSNQKITATITCDGQQKEYQSKLPPYSDSLSILLPAHVGLTKTTAKLSLTIGDIRLDRTIMVPAKKQWTVYIYPHAHVDVGYTNVQDVVEKLHIRNIDVGIDLAKQTKDYPDGARFVWNPEATWVVSNYLKQASTQQKAVFIDAVKKGWIQIDGAYGNINTSTCSDEELLRMFKDGREIGALTGVPVTTMVQVDNPGAGWGMVQAAAANGIKGFFSFPNYFDLRHRWENKPFYWQSQDGKHKLFYLQATSYGYGFKSKGRIYGLGKIQALTPAYDRLSTANPSENFIDPFIFEETERLENQQSPYDIFAMTWSMADNCLIDADLPEAVKFWNEKYAYPKLIIAGTKEILAAYEKKYKEIIPTYQGDMSEFWTQGLGADAKSVGIGRHGKEELVQAETLWAMLHRTKEAPIARFNEAWHNALLSAEHTWGYQDPSAPLAKTVEANKAAYFIKSEQEAKALINEALRPIENKSAHNFAVINTLSWQRDAIVTLSAAQSAIGDKILDEHNQPVLTQRLSTGELVFEAKKIPALGSKLYKLLPGKTSIAGKMAEGNTLKNERMAIAIDEQTGNIKRFVDFATGKQLVDSSSSFGFNSYNYLAGVRNGRDSSPIGQIKNASQVSIKVKENGPLVASLLITAKAESCDWLTREIKIIKNQPYLELVNTIDKIATRKKEGIHYGFALHVPNGKIRMDIPWGVMTPEQDQLPYSNKNWFVFQRWIDVSNADYGVTWTAIEAPIVEFGHITGTILDGARLASGWIKKVEPSQTIISWPINNHWDTNFPLEQGGIIKQSYFVLPHQGPYDPVIANQFGMAQHRPLIVVQTKANPIKQPLFTIDNPTVILSALKKSEDNKALIIRLRSLSPSAEKLNLIWDKVTPRAVYACLPDEIAQEKQTSSITMLPYGMESFRVEF